MANRIPAIILCALILVSCKGGGERLECGTIDISVSDTHMLDSRAVKDLVTEKYGCCIGENPDSLDLGRIESIVQSRAEVRNCEAWTTSDGVLHIKVTSYEPFILLKKNGVSILCDEDGYMFPTGSYDCSELLTIEGGLPVEFSAVYSGLAAKQEEREWLSGIIELIKHGFDGKIDVKEHGNITLIPESGHPEIIFGQPSDIEGKFARINEYYNQIEPVKEYKSINVNYKGQIICRNDI